MVDGCGRSVPIFNFNPPNHNSLSNRNQRKSPGTNPNGHSTALCDKYESHREWGCTEVVVRGLPKPRLHCVLVVDAVMLSIVVVVIHSHERSHGALKRFN